MDGGKDYRIEVRVKNGPMKRALEARGWTGLDLARKAGIPQSTISSFLCLRSCPLNRRGEITDHAQSIMDAFGSGTTLWDLWPEQHFGKRLKKSVASFEMSFDEVEALIEGPQASVEMAELARIALESMKPRERAIAEQWMAGATLEEANGGKSRERARQLMAKGMRRAEKALKRRGIAGRPEPFAVRQKRLLAGREQTIVDYPKIGAFE